MPGWTNLHNIALKLLVNHFLLIEKQFHKSCEACDILVLVAHDCGYPLSRCTCRATRVAADFLDFIAFCRCSTGVALHPLKSLVSHLPPPVPASVAPKFGSEEVSRYTGVSQLQLRVSRYTVQLRSSSSWPTCNLSPWTHIKHPTEWPHFQPARAGPLGTKATVLSRRFVLQRQ